MHNHLLFYHVVESKNVYVKSIIVKPTGATILRPYGSVLHPIGVTHILAYTKDVLVIRLLKYFYRYRVPRGLQTHRN